MSGLRIHRGKSGCSRHRAVAPTEATSAPIVATPSHDAVDVELPTQTASAAAVSKANAPARGPQTYQTNATGMHATTMRCQTVRHSRQSATPRIAIEKMTGSAGRKKRE